MSKSIYALNFVVQSNLQSLSWGIRSWLKPFQIHLCHQGYDMRLIKLSPCHKPDTWAEDEERQSPLLSQFFGFLEFPMLLHSFLVAVREQHDFLECFLPCSFSSSLTELGEQKPFSSEQEEFEQETKNRFVLKALNWDLGDLGSVSGSAKHCVTSGKLQDLSLPQFPISKMREIMLSVSHSLSILPVQSVSSSGQECMYVCTTPSTMILIGSYGSYWNINNNVRCLDLFPSSVLVLLTCVPI